jgi:hypothetical protein
MNSSNFGYYSYTDIYNSILSSLRSDLVEEKNSIVTAKRLTDAIWDLHLVLNSGTNQLNNTVENVKNIIEDRFKK